MTTTELKVAEERIDSISEPSPPNSKLLLRELSPSPEPTPPPDDTKSEPSLPADKANETADADIIDMATFNQIVELDEDETHDFSKGMATAYFAQAEQTLKDMDTALNENGLKKLSSLGHFLKGSSAALGLHKVQALCAKIQHYGLKRDEEADEDLTGEESLLRIKMLRLKVKEEYDLAEEWLKKWFDTHSTAAPEEEAS